uniref:Ubiquitin-like protease family profile domain-containing protein n=1 Tax=Schizaphis graminum TaxID=13262 RepID=A0A2S2PUD7_SCHGA
MTLYGEDFCTLQNKSWLNSTVIDVLLLTYVNNEIGYIPVKISNTIWSSTNIEIFKFDWTKYCVLFLPINPEGNHWTLFIMDFILGCVFYLDPLRPESGDLYLLQLKKMLFSMCDNEKAKDLLHKMVLKKIEYPLQNDSNSCGVFVLYYCSTYNPMFTQGFSKEVNVSDFRNTLQHRCLMYSDNMSEKCIMCAQNRKVNFT